MGKGGQQTVSATEFAGLTGVSRERLRTWERRHAFPAPVRQNGGARRYAVDDVARVVAVRRAVEQGVPLNAAIAATDLPTGAGISDDARAALAEHAPVTVVALSGPEPLRIEYANAAVRARPGAPVAGDELLELAPWFAEEPGFRALKRLFTSDIAAAACEHPDWVDGLRPGAHSIAFRLPHEPGQRPLVALIGIDTGRERHTRRRLAEVEREREQLSKQLEAERRFGDAAVGVAELFRTQTGSAGLADAAATLVRQLGAVDAALAPYMTGAIVIGRSARGLLGPEMVTVTRFDDLAEVLREGTPGWLGEAASGAFGAPAGLALLAVPLVAAGETLGVLLVLFDAEQELEEGHRRLLRVVASILAFALIRERLAGELRDPG
ncbi:MAG TPA: MerR family transcriptional regulator [Solirubrobacteraceae bacterium]